MVNFTAFYHSLQIFKAEYLPDTAYMPLLSISVHLCSASHYLFALQDDKPLHFYNAYKHFFVNGSEHWSCCLQIEWSLELWRTCRLVAQLLLARIKFFSIACICNDLDQSARSALTESWSKNQNLEFAAISRSFGGHSRHQELSLQTSIKFFCIFLNLNLS